ncbi:hypothetical protein P8452_45789 [Trifolium repens]|jgi:hypothetical protein|nr:hypothetical protein QL285_052390 [Trifolium repens]WJX60599.1 hypothetical protein P8452_45789 [Trifolium repens]
MPKTMNSNVQIRVNTDLEVGSEFEKTNHRSKNEDRSEAERRRREQIEKREYGSARSETMDDGGVIELQSEVLVLEFRHDDDVMGMEKRDRKR